MEVFSGDTFGDKITLKFQLEIKTCEYIVEICLSFGVAKFVQMAYTFFILSSLRIVFYSGLQLWDTLI